MRYLKKKNIFISSLSDVVLWCFLLISYCLYFSSLHFIKILWFCFSSFLVHCFLQTNVLSHMQALEIYQQYFCFPFLCIIFNWVQLEQQYPLSCLSMCFLDDFLPLYLSLWLYLTIIHAIKY